MLILALLCSTRPSKFFLPSPIDQSLVRSPAQPILFPRIDDNHCDRIHSSFTTVHCFDNGHVGKHPVAWKEYCAEYWLKELQERCTGLRDITEILLKMASNTIQSIKIIFSLPQTSSSASVRTFDMFSVSSTGF